MNVIHVPFSQQFQQFLFPNLKSLNSLVLVIGGISREKGLATFLREWTDNNQIVSLYRTIGQRGKRIEKPPPPYSSGSSLPVHRSHVEDGRRLDFKNNTRDTERKRQTSYTLLTHTHTLP